MSRGNMLSGNTTTKHNIFDLALVRNKLNQARRGVGRYTSKVATSTSSFDIETAYFDSCAVFSFLSLRRRIHGYTSRSITMYEALNTEVNYRKAEVNGRIGLSIINSVVIGGRSPSSQSATLILSPSAVAQSVINSAAFARLARWEVHP